MSLVLATSKIPVKLHRVTFFNGSSTLCFLFSGYPSQFPHDTSPSIQVISLYTNRGLPDNIGIVFVESSYESNNRATIQSLRRNLEGLSLETLLEDLEATDFVRLSTLEPRFSFFFSPGVFSIAESRGLLNTEQGPIYKEFVLKVAFLMHLSTFLEVKLY